MLVFMVNGDVIEDAVIWGTGPGEGGTAFGLSGMYRQGNGPDTAIDHTEWIDQDRIQSIHFDRDHATEPAPEPGPDDFKIGTRHAPGLHAYREPDGSVTVVHND